MVRESGYYKVTYNTVKRRVVNRVLYYNADEDIWVGRRFKSSGRCKEYDPSRFIDIGATPVNQDGSPIAESKNEERKPGMYAAIRSGVPVWVIHSGGGVYHAPAAGAITRNSKDYDFISEKPVNVNDHLPSLAERRKSGWYRVVQDTVSVAGVKSQRAILRYYHAPFKDWSVCEDLTASQRSWKDEDFASIDETPIDLGEG